MRNYLLFFLALFMMLSCEKEHRLDCFKSAGKVVSKWYDLESFSGLHVRDKMEIELVYSPGEKPKMELLFNENLHHGISKEVKGGVLLIEDRNRCNFVRSFKHKPIIRLYVNESLNSLTVEGAAKVFNRDSLRMQNLYITHTGVEDIELQVWGVYGMECNGFNSGGFKIKGFAGYIASTLDDISVLDIRDLILDDLYLFSYSLKSSHVRARDKMEIKLYGKGSVYLVSLPNDTQRDRCCNIMLEKFGEGSFIYP
jgi:hypothetical protein